MSRFISVLLGLLLALQTTAAEAPKYITPSFGTAYALSAAKDTMGTSVPCTFGEKQTKDSLDLQLTDVAIATSHPPQLKACFSSVLFATEIVLNASTAGDCGMQLRPATYIVTLTATPKKGKKPAPQTITLQVTLPPAELKPLSTQTIDRVITDPREVAELAPASLTLYETGNKTRITNLEVQQTEAAKLDAGQITGKLHFTPAPIEPGQDISIPITTTGDFPNGTAKTVVTITSPQLAGPVFVAYEVRTRYHWLFLLPAILAGLLVGFLVRVTLVRIISGNTAKLAALELLKKMRADLGRRPDADFHAEVQKLINQLNLAITQKTDLAAAVKTIDEKFGKAIADLQTRITLVMNDIEQAAARAQKAALYPEPIAAFLTMASGKLDAARSLAQAGNAADARAGLNAIIRIQQQRLSAAAGDWSDAVRKAIVSIKDLPPLPPAANLDTAIMAVDSGLAALATATDIDSLLNAVAGAASAIRHRIENTVLQWLAKYAEEIAGTLEAASKDATSVRATLNDLRNAITADTSLTLEAPVAATKRLLEAMQQAIKNAASQQNQQKISELLAAGKYLEAAVAAPGGLKMGGEAAAPPSLLTDVMTAIPAAFRMVSSTIIAPYDPIAVAQAESWLVLAAARFMQFVLVSIGVSVVGLLALAPSFDGTWRGLATAFFWGYVGDLTAEGLTSVAKGLR